MKRTYKKIKYKCIVFSIFLLLLCGSLVSAYPMTLYGEAKYENGLNADGASVVVKADGFPDETDIVSGGAWQVDVGPETGTEWPEGTEFLVTITDDIFSGNATGIVKGNLVNMGTIILYDIPADQNDNTSKDNETEVDINDNLSKNMVPTAIITPTEFIESKKGETIYVDASASYDLDGVIQAYRWDFNGNGTFDTEWLPSSSISHSYNQPGIYTLVLEVRDNNESTNRDSIIIDISHDPPVVEIICPQEDITYKNVTFKATLLRNKTITQYSWLFGDDTIDYGQIVNHIYSSPGIYFVKVIIEDEEGNSYHDLAMIDIKLDTDKDFLSNEIEDLIGSPIWTKNIFTTIQINTKTHYIIDTDNDLIYDVFFNKTEHNFSSVKRLNTSYLIDDDLDEIYEFMFDSATGTLSAYQDTSVENNNTNDTGDKKQDQESPFLSFLFIICFLIIMMVFIRGEKSRK